MFIVQWWMEDSSTIDIHRDKQTPAWGQAAPAIGPGRKPYYRSNNIRPNMMNLISFLFFFFTGHRQKPTGKQAPARPKSIN
jgi:hypothetical protein